MGLQLILQMVWLLWLTKPLVPAIAQSLALPNCQDRCGNVGIPYPFGIGNSSCYLDHWFAIDCRNSSNSEKPFLNNVEVLEISLKEATVQLLSSTISRNCVSNSSDQENRFFDLGISPFTFSETSNKFIGVGCNSLALMRDKNESTIGGCASICIDHNSPVGYHNCSGIWCCQTTIPRNLKAFDFTVQNLTPDKRAKAECMYAFVVDKKWFANLPIDFKITSEIQVPLVFNWRVKNSINGSFETSENVWCTNSSGDASMIQCSCKYGYHGNPYLFTGCEDIDECSNGSLNGCLGTCRNTNGSYLCPVEHHARSQLKVPIISVSFGFGLPFLFIGTWWMYKVWKKRRKLKRKQKFFKQNGGLLLQRQISSSEGGVEKTKLFNSKELQKATDNYNENRILGEGGQGTVYKGMLPDGRIVAVKKSKMMDEIKVVQFINEVAILSQINHRNVVKLLGCCLETEVPLLVYEFISNGTLFHYIHDQNEEFAISWEMRMQIATDVAAALSYLHNAASTPIYHRDIKSTNILLDDKYRAKVSDFGISRSVAIDQTHLTTMVQGTFGYLDPEYFQSSQLTEKSDVYSFGVVIVELLTGQKPISSTRSQEGRSLATHFIESMKENQLFNILDPLITNETKKEVIVAVAKLAKRCLNLNGKKRPTMKEAAVELEGIRMSQGGFYLPHQQNCEEVEYLETSMAEAWDVASTSTGSCFNSCATSSSDVHPLLLSK